MEWKWDNIDGKDIIGWGISLLGISVSIVSITLEIYKIYKDKRTRKKVVQKNTRKKELEKREKTIWFFVKEDFLQYLPHRIFLVFIFLIISTFIKFGFDYPFLASFNLSFTGFLICFFSWIFLNILKLWWKVSEAHSYYFSKEHKIYRCLKEDKNCYCKTWKRKIARLFLISVIVFLFICLLIKLFFLLINK